MFPASRQREPEWMDAPDANPAELRNSLIFIRRINRWLGYTRLTIAYLNRLTKSWAPQKQLRILDIATGSADIPQAIFAWGRAQVFEVEVTGLDFHAQTIRVAAGEVDQLRAVQGDAKRLPFADRSFDICITSMFLHHLAEDDVIAVLKEMNRVALHGIIIADLLRDRRAYAWITLFTLFASPMVAHDARVSVRQAFTRDEILNLCEKAGVTYTRYRRHFGHRFVIAGWRD